MMKILNATILLIAIWATAACGNQKKTTAMSTKNVEQTIALLTEKFGISENHRIQQGVTQVARLWTPADGSEADFQEFCATYYATNGAQREQLFTTLSSNYETLIGGTQVIDKQLRFKLDVVQGDVTPIDQLFGGYSSGAHLSDDLYDNKIAFVTILNFPAYSLDEKNKIGKDWSRLEWAYARMGDMFESRVPADLSLRFGRLYSEIERYISDYNIYCGNLTDEAGKSHFPSDRVLLSHWGLRDEIKANYNGTPEGLLRQQLIHQVMKRIIDQTIPSEVINSGDHTWNPFTNALTTSSGEPIKATAENGTRYNQIIKMFTLMKEEDAYYPEDNNTYIKRKFNGEMEIAVDEVERLFHQFLSNPIGNELAQIIEQRLGRPLEPFDIWYDGFKTRSTLDQELLSAQTRKRYPDAQAYKKGIPAILTQIGFTEQKAHYLADKIEVDPARGSGHAAGGSMRGDKARLRTRIPADGMDYKGFNIAMHELGHNVEQTISLYDVDYYMLNGVPNTSFTEALAFIFQSRDLSMLGIHNTDAQQERMNWYDQVWSLREIMGVSMVDIRVWKWLYANPSATPQQLQEATLNIAREVWNSYFAPGFGKSDETLLAVYSHMISYPLYLSAYSFGQIIEFQLEEHLNGKDMGAELERIFSIGRLTPDQWMQQAVGRNVSVEPMLNAFTIKQ